MGRLLPAGHDAHDLGGDLPPAGFQDAPLDVGARIGRLRRELAEGLQHVLPATLKGLGRGAERRRGGPLGIRHARMPQELLARRGVRGDAVRAEQRLRLAAGESMPFHR